jgi:hypothetical protein
MPKEKVIKQTLDKSLRKTQNQRLHREWLVKQIRKEEAKKNENI